MARKDDIVPVSDYALPDWLENFTNMLGENLDRVGLTPDDLAQILDRSAEVYAAIENNVTRQAEARAATARKNAARAGLEQCLRPLVKRINNHPGMDNSLRAVLGLNVWREHRTHQGVGPDTPHLFLEARHGAVIIHFGTNPTNERVNGKPKWARGCNIYRRIGDSGEMAMIICATNSPYRDVIESDVARVTYAAAYQGIGDTDIGGYSGTSTIAVGS